MPVALVPPSTLVGLTATDCSSGGAFGSGARLMKKDFVTPPALAVMFTGVESETDLLVMVKLFALLPAAMETLGGTWAAGLSLFKLTPPPPAGATITNSTVPRKDCPPIP